MAKLTFYGAASVVTGSKYLLEAEGARVLIDCGMFQGPKKLRLMNWEKTPFDAKNLDAVLLTHAHLDHTGYLPRVVKEGFKKRVYCTPATAELAELILLDSAKCQMYDAKYANKKGFSKHKEAKPLYDSSDVERTVKQFHPVPRGEWVHIAGPIYIRFHDAGHLLGSNMIEVEIRKKEQDPIKILFSGDVGRYDGPLYFDPSPPTECDYLICESTYGGRNHPEVDIIKSLEEVVLRSVERGGVMLLASFAIGRAQQLIYLLQVLKSEGKIPDLPIYLDSPMSIDATKIFKRFSKDHDLSEGDLNGKRSVLGGPSLHLTRSTEESKALKYMKGPAVIIASSGMMTGGRILHHLKQRMPGKENTIVIGGYMAPGTRGRKLQEGEPTLWMHGREYEVNCAIETVSGLSGHADHKDLMRWLKDLPKPKKVFLTHGEPDSALELGKALEKERDWKYMIPKIGDSVTLT